MKKLFFAAVTLAGLLSASLAFANTKGFFSDQHPLNENQLTAAKKNLAVAPTEIIINNATYNNIYVEVPEGGFTDEISPRGYDHIKNWLGTYNVRLIIRGPNGATINGFAGQVYCPHASITVYGYSFYDIVVDNKAC